MWTASFIFLMLFIISTPWYQTDADDGIFECTDSSISIVGAGLFDQSYFQDLSLTYATNRSVQIGASIQFTFNSGNSTYGLQRLENIIASQQPATFASSEVLLSQNEQLIYPTIVAFPVIIRALVIGFNLPGINQLNLSLEILADMYLSKDMTWNDTRIRQLNPGIDLPDNLIINIARADPVADTLTFTAALSKNSTFWAKNYGTFNDPRFVSRYCCDSQAWPNGGIQYFAQGTYGVIGLLSSIAYSVAYMKRSDALLNNISYANIQNPAGVMVKPTVTSVQKAADYFASKTINATFDTVYATDPGAYPLVRFSYIMVYSVTPGTLTCCAMQELVGFFYSLINDNNYRSEASSYSLAPLSDTTVQRSNAVLGQLSCNNFNMLKAFQQTLVVDDQGLAQGGVAGIVAGIIVFLVLLIAGTVLVIQQRAKAAEERAWIIAGTKVQLKDDSAATAGTKRDKSLGSLSRSSHSSHGSGSTTTNSSAQALKLLKRIAEIDELTYFLQQFEGAAEPRHWLAKLRKTMSKFRREYVHRNVLALVGVTVVEDRVYSIVEYAAKGTLHYVLHTTRYDLSESIRYNIAVDIAEGMRFLHKKGITHGFLSSITCYVDNNWTVKVANWVDVVICKEEATGLLHKLLAFSDDSLDDEESLIRLLYLDLEVCMGSEFVQACDISSYGLLLLEIWTGQIPYTSEVEQGRVSFKDILKDKFTKHRFTKPSLVQLPQRLHRLIEDCLRDLHKRYTFNELLEQLYSQRPSSKGIVDEMMVTMESYTEQLEQKVDERTQELSVVTKRMQDLLHAVLPPQVAQKLFKGEAVEPELFESVSIFFSDIVGFTTISSKSTPLQVMTFLNDLWIAFDTTIELFDVYKVDTIGDAYMVCSGCPQRNDMDHAKHIANLSLALTRRVKVFKIRHMPNEQLKIRIGLNSGQVIAGVVGTKMPQFCVFGETVITAMKMESSGIPMKIQVSEYMQAILESRFSEFRTEYRGEVDLEGKRTIKTYWLLLEDEGTAAVGPLYAGAGKS